jgi:hypothetical protein
VKSFSLYPPAGALVVLAVGVGFFSVPAALIVSGGLVLAAWVGYFGWNLRAK